MNISITYFGKLTDITGKSEEHLSIDAPTVSEVKNVLEQSYPVLKQMTFQIAENNTILKEEDAITIGKIDIFPPFSGG